MRNLTGKIGSAVASSSRLHQEAAMLGKRFDEMTLEQEAALMAEDEELKRFMAMEPMRKAEDYEFGQDLARLEEVTQETSALDECVENGRLSEEALVGYRSVVDPYLGKIVVFTRDGI